MEWWYWAGIVLWLITGYLAVCTFTATMKNQGRWTTDHYGPWDYATIGLCTYLGLVTLLMVAWGLSGLPKSEVKHSWKPW